MSWMTVKLLKHFREIFDGLYRILSFFVVCWKPFLKVGLMGKLRVSEAVLRHSQEHYSSSACKSTRKRPCIVGCGVAPVKRLRSTVQWLFWPPTVHCILSVVHGAVHTMRGSRPGMTDNSAFSFSSSASAVATTDITALSRHEKNQIISVKPISYT